MKTAFLFLFLSFHIFSQESRNDFKIVAYKNLSGVQNLSGEWIIQPLFEKITPIFPTAASNNLVLNYVFICETIDLDRRIYDYEYEYFEGDTNFISIYSKSGLMMHDSVFYGMTMLGEIAGDSPQKPIEYTFFNAKQNVMLMSDLSLIPIKYSIYKKHLDWYFGYGKTADGKSVILDRNLTEIVQFNEVKAIEYDDHFLFDNIEEYNPRVFENNLPYVLVYRLNPVTSNSEMAFYDLNWTKVISPWLPTNNTRIQKLDGNAYFPQMSFIYTNEVLSKSGFIIEGISSGTECIYSQITTQFPFITTIGENEMQQDLFLWSQDTCKLVATGKKFIYSEWYGFQELYDLETGELIYSETSNFPENFMVSTNEEGKMGFVLLNGKEIEPQFDDFVLDTTFPSVLVLRLGDFFGSLDIKTGGIIFPKYKEQLQFINDDYSLLPYIKTDTCFVDIHGNVFYNDKHDYEVFKEKGKYGIRTRNDFDNGKLKIILKPSYKSLEIIDTQLGYIVAEKKGKKKGLINFKNETIIPFEYNVIEYSKFPLFGMSNSLSVKKEKKQGLFVMGQGLIFPVIYDGINYLRNEKAVQERYIVVEQESKKGLALYTGRIIVPIIFTGIKLIKSVDENQYLELEKDNKFYYPRFEPTFSQLEISDYGPAFDSRFGNLLVRNENGKVHYFNIRNGLEVFPNDNKMKFANKEFIIIQDLTTNKFGALDFFGNELVPMIYENASFMESRSDVFIGYENGVMYYVYPASNERYLESEW